MVQAPGLLTRSLKSGEKMLNTYLLNDFLQKDEAKLKI